MKNLLALCLILGAKCDHLVAVWSPGVCVCVSIRVCILRARCNQYLLGFVRVVSLSYFVTCLPNKYFFSLIRYKIFPQRIPVEESEKMYYFGIVPEFALPGLNGSSISETPHKVCALWSIRGYQSYQPTRRMPSAAACQFLLWEFYHDNSEAALGPFQASLISFPSLLLSEFSYIWLCITMAADPGPGVWLRHHPVHFSPEWVIMSPPLQRYGAENRLTFLLRIPLGRRSVIISQNPPFILQQTSTKVRKGSKCWDPVKWRETAAPANSFCTQGLKKFKKRIQRNWDKPLVSKTINIYFRQLKKHLSL